MHIARTLEGERITNSVGISMMFEVMLQYASKCYSSSFSVFEFDRETGGKGDEVSKVRVEEIVSVSKVYLGETGCRVAIGVIPVDDGGWIWLTASLMQLTHCREH